MLPTVVTTTLPTPIYIPPTIVTTSLNINVTKVTELNPGRYSEIIYIQPCLCENSIIRIATVYRHQNIYLLKVIDINGTDLISLQFSAPNYLTSCIRTSHDLTQLLIPAITDDGSTTFMAINMCSLTIKRIDTPISANNYGYICTSLTPIHSGIATFKSPNSSRTVAILNITSGNLSLYKLNINQSISKPLLSTPSTLITILGSGIYDLVVYDLIKNSSVRFLSCDVVGLCHVSAKYVVLGCTSWSRHHTYQSYMVLNLIDRSYRMIPTYKSLTYNALIAIELSRGEVVMGYTTEAPFGIGGPAIYVMMLTNGKTLSWYKSVNLTNYVAGAGYGKVTTFGNYVALLLKHEEGQPYYTSSSLINKLALLIVNPYSGAIGISHVNPIDDKIIWDFSYVVENYELIPIVKEEHVYLEIFSIEAFEKPAIVTLISKSYVNTIATLTTTRTETKYLYYTKTSTKTIEKTIMRTKELTHTVYIYTTAYPYEITKTMYITLYRPITSISTVTRTKTVTLEIIKTVPSLTRPAMEIIALLGAAAVAIATILLLAITIVRRK